MPLLTPNVPGGLIELMKNLAKEVLRDKPENIYEFAAVHFEKLIHQRDGSLDKSYEQFVAFQEHFEGQQRYAIPLNAGFTCQRPTPIQPNLQSKKSKSDIMAGFKAMESINEEDVLAENQIYSDEKYQKAIYVIQRYYRRYMAASKKKQSNTALATTTAAIIIQRTMRRLFSNKIKLKTRDEDNTKRHDGVLQDDVDNISEAASYTSSSTIQMLADSQEGRENRLPGHEVVLSDVSAADDDESTEFKEQTQDKVLAPITKKNLEVPAMEMDRKSIADENGNEKSIHNDVVAEDVHTIARVDDTSTAHIGILSTKIGSNDQQNSLRTNTVEIDSNNSDSTHIITTREHSRVAAVRKVPQTFPLSTLGASLDTLPATQSPLMKEENLAIRLPNRNAGNNAVNLYQRQFDSNAGESIKTYDVFYQDKDDPDFSDSLNESTMERDSLDNEDLEIDSLESNDNVTHGNGIVKTEFKEGDGSLYGDTDEVEEEAKQNVPRSLELERVPTYLYGIHPPRTPVVERKNKRKRNVSGESDAKDLDETVKQTAEDRSPEEKSEEESFDSKESTSGESSVTQIENKNVRRMSDIKLELDEVNLNGNEGASIRTQELNVIPLRDRKENALKENVLKNESIKLKPKEKLLNDMKTDDSLDKQTIGLGNSDLKSASELGSTIEKGPGLESENVGQIRFNKKGNVKHLVNVNQPLDADDTALGEKASFEIAVPSEKLRKLQDSPENPKYCLNKEGTFSKVHVLDTVENDQDKTSTLLQKHSLSTRYDAVSVNNKRPTDLTDENSSPLSVNEFDIKETKSNSEVNSQNSLSQVSQSEQKGKVDDPAINKSGITVEDTLSRSNSIGYFAALYGTPNNSGPTTSGAMNHEEVESQLRELQSLSALYPGLEIRDVMTEFHSKDIQPQSTIIHMDLPSHSKNKEGIELSEVNDISKDLSASTDSAKAKTDSDTKECSDKNASAANVLKTTSETVTTGLREKAKTSTLPSDNSASELPKECQVKIAPELETTKIEDDGLNKDSSNEINLIATHESPSLSNRKQINEFENSQINDDLKSDIVKILELSNDIRVDNGLKQFAKDDKSSREFEETVFGTSAKEKIEPTVKSKQIVESKNKKVKHEDLEKTPQELKETISGISVEEKIEPTEESKQIVESENRNLKHEKQEFKETISGTSVEEKVEPTVESNKIVESGNRNVKYENLENNELLTAVTYSSNLPDISKATVDTNKEIHPSKSEIVEPHISKKSSDLVVKREPENEPILEAEYYFGKTIKDDSKNKSINSSVVDILKADAATTTIKVAAILPKLEEEVNILDDVLTFSQSVVKSNVDKPFLGDSKSDLIEESSLTDALKSFNISKENENTLPKNIAKDDDVTDEMSKNSEGHSPSSNIIEKSNLTDELKNLKNIDQEELSTQVNKNLTDNRIELKDDSAFENEKKFDNSSSEHVEQDDSLILNNTSDSLERKMHNVEVENLTKYKRYDNLIKFLGEEDSTAERKLHSSNTHLSKQITFSAQISDKGDESENEYNSLPSIKVSEPNSDRILITNKQLNDEVLSFKELSKEDSKKEFTVAEGDHTKNNVIKNIVQEEQLNDVHFPDTNLVKFEPDVVPSTLKDAVNKAKSLNSEVKVPAETNFDNFRLSETDQANNVELQKASLIINEPDLETFNLSSKAQSNVGLQENVIEETNMDSEMKISDDNIFNYMTSLQTPIIKDIVKTTVESQVEQLKVNTSDSLSVREENDLSGKNGPSIPNHGEPNKSDQEIEEDDTKVILVKNQSSTDLPAKNIEPKIEQFEKTKHKLDLNVNYIENTNGKDICDFSDIVVAKPNIEVDPNKSKQLGEFSEVNLFEGNAEIEASGSGAVVKPDTEVKSSKIKNKPDFEIGELCNNTETQPLNKVVIPDDIIVQHKLENEKLVAGKSAKPENTVILEDVSCKELPVEVEEKTTKANLIKTTEQIEIFAENRHKVEDRVVKDQIQNAETDVNKAKISLNVSAEKKSIENLFGTNNLQDDNAVSQSTQLTSYDESNAETSADFSSIGKDLEFFEDTINYLKSATTQLSTMDGIFDVDQSVPQQEADVENIKNQGEAFNDAIIKRRKRSVGSEIALTAEDQAAIVIQSAVRGYRARQDLIIKKTQSEREVKEELQQIQPISESDSKLPAKEVQTLETVESKTTASGKFESEKIQSKITKELQTILQTVDSLNELSSEDVRDLKTVNVRQSESPDILQNIHKSLANLQENPTKSDKYANKDSKTSVAIISPMSYPMVVIHPPKDIECEEEEPLPSEMVNNEPDNKGVEKKVAGSIEEVFIPQNKNPPTPTTKPTDDTQIRNTDDPLHQTNKDESAPTIRTKPTNETQTGPTDDPLTQTYTNSERKISISENDNLLTTRNKPRDDPLDQTYKASLRSTQHNKVQPKQDSVSLDETHKFRTSIRREKPVERKPKTKTIKSISLDDTYVKSEVSQLASGRTKIPIPEKIQNRPLKEKSTIKNDDTKSKGLRSKIPSTSDLLERQRSANSKRNQFVKKGKSTSVKEQNQKPIIFDLEAIKKDLLSTKKVKSPPRSGRKIKMSKNRPKSPTKRFDISQKSQNATDTLELSSQGSKDKLSNEKTDSANIEESKEDTSELSDLHRANTHNEQIDVRQMSDKGDINSVTVTINPIIISDTTKSATAIQKNFRGYKTRKDLGNASTRVKSFDVIASHTITVLAKDNDLEGKEGEKMPKKDVEDDGNTINSKTIKRVEQTKGCDVLEILDNLDVEDTFNKSATTIQKSFRGYKARKDLRNSKNFGDISGQTFTVSAKYNDSYEKENSDAYKKGEEGAKVSNSKQRKGDEQTIKSDTSRIFDSLKTDVEILKKATFDKSATTIQKNFRGYRTRKDLRNVSTKAKSFDDISDQTFTVTDKNKETAKKGVDDDPYDEMPNKDLKMTEDSGIFDSLKSDVEVLEKVTLDKSARTIQKNFRGYWTRKVLKNNLAKVENFGKISDPTLILETNKIANIKDNTSHEISTTTSKSLDIFDSLKRNVEDFKNSALDKSATTIQRNFRGYKTRKELKELSRNNQSDKTFKKISKDTKIWDSANRNLQKNADVFQDNVQKESKSQNNSIPKIITREENHLKDDAIESAVTKIQNAFRCYKTRKDECAKKLLGQEANKDKVNNIFDDPTKTYTKQNLLEENQPNVDKKMLASEMHKEKCATTIQKTYRGYKTRKNLLDNENYSILNVIGSYGTKEKFQNVDDKQLKETKQNVIDIQKNLQHQQSENGNDTAAGSLGVKKTSSQNKIISNQVAEEAAVTIQKMYKGFKTRKEFGKSFRDGDSKQNKDLDKDKQKHIGDVSDLPHSSLMSSEEVEANPSDKTIPERKSSIDNQDRDKAFKIIPAGMIPAARATSASALLEAAASTIQKAYRDYHSKKDIGIKSYSHGAQRKEPIENSDESSTFIGPDTSFDLSDVDSVGTKSNSTLVVLDDEMGPDIYLEENIKNEDSRSVSPQKIIRKRSIIDPTAPNLEDILNADESISATEKPQWFVGDDLIIPSSNDTTPSAESSSSLKPLACSSSLSSIDSRNEKLYSYLQPTPSINSAVVSTSSLLFDSNDTEMHAHNTVNNLNKNSRAVSANKEENISEQVSELKNWDFDEKKSIEIDDSKMTTEKRKLEKDLFEESGDSSHRLTSMEGSLILTSTDPFSPRNVIDDDKDDTSQPIMTELCKNCAEGVHEIHGECLVAPSTENGSRLNEKHSNQVVSVGDTKDISHSTYKQTDEIKQFVLIEKAPSPTVGNAINKDAEKVNVTIGDKNSDVSEMSVLKITKNEKSVSQTTDDQNNDEKSDSSMVTLKIEASADGERSIKIKTSDMFPSISLIPPSSEDESSDRESTHAPFESEKITPDRETSADNINQEELKLNLDESTENNKNKNASREEKETKQSCKSIDGAGQLSDNKTEENILTRPTEDRRRDNEAEKQNGTKDSNVKTQKKLSSGGTAKDEIIENNVIPSLEMGGDQSTAEEDITALSKESHISTSGNSSRHLDASVSQEVNHTPNKGLVIVSIKKVISPMAEDEIDQTRVNKLSSEKSIKEEPNKHQNNKQTSELTSKDKKTLQPSEDDKQTLQMGSKDEIDLKASKSFTVEPHNSLGEKSLQSSKDDKPTLDLTSGDQTDLKASKSKSSSSEKYKSQDEKPLQPLENKKPTSELTFKDIGLKSSKSSSGEQYISLGEQALQPSDDDKPTSDLTSKDQTDLKASKSKSSSGEQYNPQDDKPLQPLEYDKLTSDLTSKDQIDLEALKSKPSSSEQYNPPDDKPQQPSEYDKPRSDLTSGDQTDLKASKSKSSSGEQYKSQHEKPPQPSEYDKLTSDLTSKHQTDLKASKSTSSSGEQYRSQDDKPLQPSEGDQPTSHLTSEDQTDVKASKSKSSSGEQYKSQDEKPLQPLEINKPTSEMTSKDVIGLKDSKSSSGEQYISLGEKALQPSEDDKPTPDLTSEDQTDLKTSKSKSSSGEQNKSQNEKPLQTSEDDKPTSDLTCKDINGLKASKSSSGEQHKSLDEKPVEYSEYEQQTLEVASQDEIDLKASKSSSVEQYKSQDEKPLQRSEDDKPTSDLTSEDQTDLKTSKSKSSSGEQYKSPDDKPLQTSEDDKPTSEMTSKDVIGLKDSKSSSGEQYISLGEKALQPDDKPTPDLTSEDQTDLKTSKSKSSSGEQNKSQNEKPLQTSEDDKPTSDLTSKDINGLKASKSASGEQHKSLDEKPVQSSDVDQQILEVASKDEIDLKASKPFSGDKYKSQDEKPLQPSEDDKPTLEMTSKDEIGMKALKLYSGEQHKSQDGKPLQFSEDDKPTPDLTSEDQTDLKTLKSKSSSGEQNKSQDEKPLQHLENNKPTSELTYKDINGLKASKSSSGEQYKSLDEKPVQSSDVDQQILEVASKDEIDLKASKSSSGEQYKSKDEKPLQRSEDDKPISDLTSKDQIGLKVSKSSSGNELKSQDEKLLQPSENDKLTAQIITEMEKEPSSKQDLAIEARLEKLIDETTLPDDNDSNTVSLQDLPINNSPNEVVEVPCVKKILPPPSELSDQDESELESTTTKAESTTTTPGYDGGSDIDAQEIPTSVHDSLDAITEKHRETEEMVARMHQRRASEHQISIDNIDVQPAFEEPICEPIRSMKELQKSSSVEVDDDIILQKLQRGDTTRESSAQSESVIFGDSSSQFEESEDAFNEKLQLKTLHRMNTIAVDHQSGYKPTNILLKSVTIDDTVKYIDPEKSTEESGGSFSMDDAMTADVREKMMAYSVSEADSDYYEAGERTSRLHDDFNISTALENLPSSDTDSTIVSAATKIQAGARGFLTRRRLRRASMGTRSSLVEEAKASFGNDAIGESLEQLVEEKDAKRKPTAQYHRQVGVNSLPSALGNSIETETVRLSPSREATLANDESEGLNLAAKLTSVAEEITNLPHGDGSSFDGQREHQNLSTSSAEYDVNGGQATEDDSAELPANLDETLAAKRLTLQRGDAMRNDSTPDDDNGNGKQVDPAKSIPANTTMAVATDGDTMSIHQKNTTTTLESATGGTTSTTSTTTTERKNYSDAAMTTKMDKVKWFAMRQNSMPVQIDSEVFRVLPKHMRKRIKSAEGEKKKRIRLPRD